MDLMTAREEIQSLQHQLYKIEANKHMEVKEMEKVSSLKDQAALNNYPLLVVVSK